MDKKVLWICLALGTTVGGFVPTIWGASSLGVVSLLFSGIGGLGGVWMARRISESL